MEINVLKNKILSFTSGLIKKRDRLVLEQDKWRRRLEATSAEYCHIFCAGEHTDKCKQAKSALDSDAAQKATE